MTRASWGTGIAALAAGLALGCGAAPGGPGEQAQALPLQPRAVGTSWTYQTAAADGTGIEDKTTTVVATEEVGGIAAAVVESVKAGKTSKVWLGEWEGKIVRLREETSESGKPEELRRFEPGSFRAPTTLDGLRVGESVSSIYDELVVDDSGAELTRTSRNVVWEVEALDDVVETPAGRFGAVRLLRRGDEADGSVEKRVWYAPGVGKVKEQGNRIELLTSFQIAR